MRKTKKEESNKEKKAGKSALKQWNPEIAMVAVAAAVLIISISVFSGFYLGNRTNVEVVADSGSPSVYMCAESFSNLNKDLSIPLEPLSTINACNEDGKLKLVAFGSLSCPYCVAQEPVLERFAAENSNVELKIVCLDDQESCEASEKNFVPYAEGLLLSEQYAKELEGGIPVLVVNCAFKRIGSYALRDESMNTSMEYEDLNKLFELLS